jgi:ABC-2 type transport system permease protein
VTLLWLGVRSHRTGTIALALIGALSGLVNAIGFIEVAGHTQVERQMFAQQMEILGRQLTYLLPAPVQLDTLGGYLTWRAFGSVALLYAIWGVLAGSGAARGDEERGLTEAWLSAGVSRARWLVTRSAGFLVAALLSVVATCLATELGSVIAGETVGIGAMASEAAIVLGITLVGFGAGATVAQFVITRRAAATLGSALLLALYALNSSSRAGADLGAVRWLSPFYLFDRSRPLLDGGTLDIGATAALYALWAVLVALATAAFARRDIGGPLVRRGAERMRSTFRPSPDPLLRTPVLATVDQQRWWVIGWAIGLAGLGYFLTSLVRTMIDSLASIPTLRVYFERLGIAAYADVVGVIWFSTALLLLSVLVIVQANGWAADDAEGRLEMVLAAGASRARVVLERIAAVVIEAAIVIAAASGVVLAAATASGIEVPTDRFLLATAFTLPVAFAIAGVGQLLVDWRPRLAVVLLGTVTVMSYFIQQLAPLFGWPEWLRKLSFFELYGAPMTNVDWGGIAALLAVGATGTVAALVTMRRRDVGV